METRSLTKGILLALACLVFAWGCGSSDEGYLTFRLVWPAPASRDSSLAAHRSSTGFRPAADYPWVSSVSASLWDGDQRVTRRIHSFHDHQGEMAAPVGTYLLRLEGMDSSGVVRYRAEVSSVKIRRNRVTSLGDVTMEDLGIPVPEAPAAPSNLQMTAVSLSRIDLSWSDNSANEEGFGLEIKKLEENVWVRIANLGANINTCSDTTADCGQVVSYRVLAFNEFGNSPYSNEVSVTTDPCPHSLSAPSGLYAEAATATEIDLVWIDNSDNEDGFRIMRKTGENGTYSEMVTIGMGETGYQDKDLRCGTTYFYRILAYNEVGNSEYSNEISATAGGCWQAVQVDAGGYHNCIIVLGDGIKCWGDNYYGQLGDKNHIIVNYQLVTTRDTPVDVEGLNSGVKVVSAGDGHTCAINDAGGVKCWGRGDYGQLGNHSRLNQEIPVDVMFLHSGVKAISAGYSHTCAVTEAGGVKCWGNNEKWQLGNGNNTAQDIPMDVTGLYSGVKSVSAGYSHTCALTEAGGVKCWGSSYEIAYQTYIIDPVPADVRGLHEGIVAIATSYYHTCVLNIGGGVQCWGKNNSGNLGTGYNQSSTVPVQVVGLESGVTAISTGAQHSCALTNAGKIKCWGDNQVGQLGDGTTISRNTPVEVISPDLNFIEVTAGMNHTCALTEKKELKCWGHNFRSALGNKSIGNFSSKPVDVMSINP